jgi:hypothetical protein
MVLRKSQLITAAVLAIATLAGCGTWISDQIQDGDLRGTVLIQWDGQDKFIYRKWNNPKPLSFRPSFFKGSDAIIPDDMYTTGGSVPQVFWGIPGLSPWALGPAYIIHDWIFEVRRCKLPAPPEVRDITFDQSAMILAEVGKELIDTGLVKDDMLGAIVWAVRTNYARGLWETQKLPQECVRPPRFRAARAQIVANFEIPPRRARLR